MLVWNDLVADEKLRCTTKALMKSEERNVQPLGQLSLRGHVGAPDRTIEALRLELGYFVECIMNNEAPFNDGPAGSKVVRMLEAASQSLAKRGELVYV